MEERIKVENLRRVIHTVSEEIKTTKLTYSINFWFGCSVSVKINDVEINISRYGLNLGWGTFGNSITEEDLTILEQEGFLKKVSETIDENDPLEKSVEYEIIKTA